MFSDGVARLVQPALYQCLASFWVAFTQILQGMDAVCSEVTKILTQFAPCRDYSGSLKISHGKRPDLALCKRAMLILVVQHDFVLCANRPTQGGLPSFLRLG